MKKCGYCPALIALALLVWGATLGCNSQTPTEKLLDAQTAFNSGDVKAALDLAAEVRQMPEIAPDVWGQASLMLAQMQRGIPDVGAAKKTLDEIIQRFGVEDPNPALAGLSREAVLMRVQLEAGEGKYQEALDDVKATSDTLTTESPFSRNLTYIYSELLAQENRFDEAFNAIDALIQTETDMNSVPYLLQRASVYRQAEERFDDAAQVFLNYLKLNPDPRLEAELTLQAALAYPPPEQDAEGAHQARRIALLQEASALLEKLRSEFQDPTMKGRVNLLESTAAWGLGDAALAKDFLTSVTESLAAMPEVRGPAMLGLAELYASEKNYDAALEQYKKTQDEFGLDTQFGQNAAAGKVEINRLMADEAIQKITDEGEKSPAAGAEATTRTVDAVLMPGLSSSAVPSTALPAETQSTSENAMAPNSAMTPEAVRTPESVEMPAGGPVN